MPASPLVAAMLMENYTDFACLMYVAHALALRANTLRACLHLCAFAHISKSQSMYWVEPRTSGPQPSPRRFASSALFLSCREKMFSHSYCNCRGHTATAIGKNLYITGGTDGEKSFNDVHILDTSMLVLCSHDVLTRFFRREVAVEFDEDKRRPASAESAWHVLLSW